jgi:hypothetical protein
MVVDATIAVYPIPTPINCAGTYLGSEGDGGV